MFNIKKYKTKYDKYQDKRRDKRRGGFTLIELLVVIAIIALLSAVVVTNLNASRLKANDSRRDEDMRNVKNALELYGAKNSYDYSGLVDGFTPYAYQSDKNNSYANIGDGKIFNILSRTTDIAYAQSNSGCVNFNTMAQRLVADEFLASVPKDPSDSADICYKAYTAIDSTSGDLIIGAYALKSEKYVRAPSFNKKTGFIISKSETPTTIPSACAEFGYPAYDPHYLDNPCEGSGNNNKIADSVIGVTSGEEVALVVSGGGDNGGGGGGGTCLNPAYTTQSECELDRSYCSGSLGGPYTDSSSCTAASYMSGAGCSGSTGGPYTDPSSCTSAGYYAGVGCSGGGYPDQSSCEAAGYYAGAGCSGGGYNDEASCIGAGSTTSGSCSNGSYTDQSSCESAGYMESPGCSYSIYGDQENCQGNGYMWSQGGFVSYGYTWTPGAWTSYGYTWYPGTWTPYNYTWSSGTWTLYNYTWNYGTLTSYGYTWNSQPGSVWTAQ